MSAAPEARSPSAPLWQFLYPARASEEESAYRSYYLVNDIRQVSMITWFALGLMVCLSLSDIINLAVNPTLTDGLIIRTIFILAGFVMIFSINRFRSARTVDVSAVLYTLFIATGIATFHTISDVGVVRMGTVVTLFIFVIHLTFPTYAAYCALPVLIVGTTDTLILFDSATADTVRDRGIVVIVFVASYLIAVAGSALLQRSRYEVFVANQHVQTLSGLLPICASCKKVKDDDGEYQAIEKYLEARSDAHFTHSICPSCMKELYGGLDEEDAQQR